MYVCLCGLKTILKVQSDWWQWIASLGAVREHIYPNSKLHFSKREIPKPRPSDMPRKSGISAGCNWWGLGVTEESLSVFLGWFNWIPYLLWCLTVTEPPSHDIIWIWKYPNGRKVSSVFLQIGIITLVGLAQIFKKIHLFCVCVPCEWGGQRIPNRSLLPLYHSWRLEWASNLTPSSFSYWAISQPPNMCFRSIFVTCTCCCKRYLYPSMLVFPWYYYALTSHSVYRGCISISLFYGDVIHSELTVL